MFQPMTLQVLGAHTGCYAAWLAGPSLLRVAAALAVWPVIGAMLDSGKMHPPKGQAAATAHSQEEINP